MAFTTAQRAQLNRMSAERRATINDLKHENKTPDQLRARVNILKVADGVVTFSSDSNYTATERQTIADGLRDGDKWLYRIPELLIAGLSVEQRLTALEAS